MAGQAVAALFRGENSHEARVGGVILAGMAIAVRMALAGKLPDFPDEPEET